MVNVKRLSSSAVQLAWVLMSIGQSMTINCDSILTKKGELNYSQEETTPIIIDVAKPMYFDECDSLNCVGTHPEWLAGSYLLTQDRSTIFGEIVLYDNGHFFLNNSFNPSRSSSGHWDYSNDGLLVINSGKKMLQVDEKCDESLCDSYYTLLVKRVISSENGICDNEPNCIIYAITELGDTIVSIPDKYGFVYISKSSRLFEIYAMAGIFMSKNNSMIETNHYIVKDSENSNYFLLNCAVRRHFDCEKWIVDENQGIHALNSNGKHYNDYPLQRTCH